MISKGTRILVVCEMGSVRSVMFANILKLQKGYDNVINCGIETTHADTFAMLAKWADVVYVTADRTIWRLIPHTFRAKAHFVDVGKDVWHNAEDPRLKQVMEKKITELGL